MDVGHSQLGKNGRLAILALWRTVHGAIDEMQHGVMMSLVLDVRGLRVQLFVTARAEQGDLESKLVVVQGDIENASDLGIDDVMKGRLIENVSVVFHLAATVSFNEPLRYFPLTHSFIHSFIH